MFGFISYVWEAMKEQKIKPIDLIDAIRNTDGYIKIIFMQGSCYQFHLFLKTVYPTSIPYLNQDKDHIVTKIDNHLYDIRGIIDLKFEELYSPLSNLDLELVKEWSFKRNNFLKITECTFCEEPLVV